MNLWVYIKDKSQATYLKLCCYQECTLSCCLSLGQPELSNMSRHVKNIYMLTGFERSQELLSIEWRLWLTEYLLSNYFGRSF